MTPSKLRSEVVLERVAWIERMLAALRALPTRSLEEFRSDPRNVAAAESYLRRALEALLDLCRHILAKGLGQGVAEYKEVATALQGTAILDVESARLLREMAGYRNRIVHFYHEIADDELFEICTRQLTDIEAIRERLLSWLRAHPDLMDTRL